ncbi:MAG TPA: hypothetical protein PKA27_17000 [Fimbriimonadaceae bacterium]|nr:hypothetical protein [Fimbriimonadaceae bacterium]
MEHILCGVVCGNVHILEYERFRVQDLVTQRVVLDYCVAFGILGDHALYGDAE